MKQIYSLQIDKGYSNILGNSPEETQSYLKKITWAANASQHGSEFKQLQDLILLLRLGHLKTQWSQLDTGDPLLLLEVKV